MKWMLNNMGDSGKPRKWYERDPSYYQLRMKLVTERLSDKCNQDPILEFEGFVIRPFNYCHLFMENPDGEGTQISKIEFLVTLKKLFERNF